MGFMDILSFKIDIILIKKCAEIKKFNFKVYSELKKIYI